MVDNTAGLRQKKRFDRLKEQNVSRATVLVHEKCKSALEALKPHFADASQAKVLNEMAKAVNVVNV